MAKTHFSGPLIINDQLAGTEYTIISDANDNELLATNPVASATNHIGIRNAATGNNPIIYNAGEVDTGVTISGSDGTNYEEIAVFDTNASAVNYLEFDNAATGNDPTILANGDDTNVAFQLSATGTAHVKIGSLSLNGSAASGSATINAQRGSFRVALSATGTAGTQSIALVNNKITPSTLVMCQLQQFNGSITAGVVQIAHVRNETAGSATIVIVNNDDNDATGTANINFIIL